MAITFVQEKEKQKYLFLALIIIVLVSIIIWWGFFKGEKPIRGVILKPELIISGYQEVKINFEALEKPELRELILFEKILPFEGEIGRENPFLPYEPLSI